MSKFPLKFLLLFGIILLPFFSQNVFACLCHYTPTPYKTFQKSASVFIGKVIGVKGASGKEIIDDKSSDSMEYGRPKEETRFYRFAVQEWFKGIKSSEVEVSIDINMCQFGLDKGDTYLIYAYEQENSKGKLLTDLFCSRNGGLETAQDDVYFLREMLKNKPEPRIYGSVQIYDKDPASGSFQYPYLEGIKIIAQSGRKRFVTVTDKNGLYSFTKLPNGKYKVYPKLPKEYALEWLHIHEINLRSTDQLFNYDYRTFTGRNAYSEFRVRWNKQINVKQK